MNNSPPDTASLKKQEYPIALLDLAEKFYEYRKFDVNSLYRRCEIKAEQISRQQNSISGLQFYELVLACASISLPGKPLSVQMADCIPITTPGGMFGVASFTAKDVQQALQVMIDYSHTVMPAYTFDRIGVGSEWHILLKPAVSFGKLQAEIDEMVCGYFLNFRHFSKWSNPPVQVHLSHAALGDKFDYENQFKAEFLFSQQACKVVFKKHHLIAPLITHNKATFNEVYLKLKNSSRAASAHCAEETVRKILQQRLAEGRSTSITQLAELLNISERTLARKLQREQVSFVEIKQQTSIDYAKLLLDGSEYPISKIASICGYNSDSNFSRAFKNLTGETPKQFRNRK
ncbi:helix-turn-helix domain-containing protein [Spongiibacter sp.]|uniref:helix-turn-helix domain-containing protein n=1 Tax=Spongiibacter sp. TaxID=2024860 RepID=UPI00356A4EEB